MTKYESCVSLESFKCTALASCDYCFISMPTVEIATEYRNRAGGRYHNLKNGKEASTVTEGKSSMMQWER